MVSSSLRSGQPEQACEAPLVFDAAATVEGVSLNSKLLKGSQKYIPLSSILFNFRVEAAAVCGDIKDMFHQILVVVDTYEMLVMTFGTA